MPTLDTTAYLYLLSFLPFSSWNSFIMFTKLIWNVQQEETIEHYLRELLASDTKEYVGFNVLWLKIRRGRLFNLDSYMWNEVCVYTCAYMCVYRHIQIVI